MLNRTSLNRFVEWNGRALQKYAVIGSRIIVGGLLVLAGAGKIGDTLTLLWEIEQYQLLPEFLEVPFSLVLSPAEIVIGLLLLTGLFLRPAAVLAGLLALSFTAAKIQALVRGIDIDICACFGPGIPLYASQTLVLDFVMIILAIFIITLKINSFTLDGILHKRRHGSDSRDTSTL